ncbi:MAG: Asp-tRNA(Asn)/Glu-tRNA(Gln) amidotransferase subunit GatC [Cytophagales bacterium]|nr:Asp-tRNA(Asn)/Glu-tRNA(Gln) amidotransferase subunit GatC [Bernardetiaceae bacterium]MDW8205871.1 Asp-tRNA(Asn)/Glu-tRNA(Gln) amidotransferase subunit GatC [Cytophagales bacterium]
MQITAEILDKIAHLARLQIAPEDRLHLLESLNNIIAWVNQLQKVDTTGVEPLTHMTYEINRFRPDVIEQTLSHEQALSQAPDHDADYFRVPKVID